MLREVTVGLWWMEVMVRKARGKTEGRRRESKSVCTDPYTARSFTSVIFIFLVFTHDAASLIVNVFNCLSQLVNHTARLYGAQPAPQRSSCLHCSLRPRLAIPPLLAFFVQHSPPAANLSQVPSRHTFMGCLASANQKTPLLAGNEGTFDPSLTRRLVRSSSEKG